MVDLHQTVDHHPGVPFQGRSAVSWCSKTFFLLIPSCKVVTYWLRSKVGNVTFYCIDNSVQSCVPMLLRRSPDAFDVERIKVDLSRKVVEIFQ